MINFAAVKETAQQYSQDIANFTSDLVKIKSLDSQEGEAVKRVKQEMEKLGFDEVRIDPFGNVIGRMGSGKTVVALDAHVDTVEAGDESAWDLPPFSGIINDGKVFGRGASDQKGALASMVYGTKIMKDLHLLDGLTVYAVVSVNEEECEGLSWQYIINEENIHPEFVIITEATEGKIAAGQRGRMNIRITTKGLSAHGSVPERGVNAVYKMAPIISEIEKLNERIKYHPILGKGSITVSQIFCRSASSCAVPDECSITLDRRLTKGETDKTALEELRNLESVKKAKATVELFEYDIPTHTGLVYPTKSYFPVWLIEEDHPAVKAAKEAYKKLFAKDISVYNWVFSTNGVSVMGLFGIPCIGFGPGREARAHAPNEFVEVEDLAVAAMMYAVIPQIYLQQTK